MSRILSFLFVTVCPITSKKGLQTLWSPWGCWTRNTPQGAGSPRVKGTLPFCCVFALMARKGVRAAEGTRGLEVNRGGSESQGCLSSLSILLWAKD